MDLGTFAIGETIHFRANTVNKTGSAEDATSGPAYRVYKNDSDTTSTTGTMSKADDSNTTGFYRASFSSTGFGTGQYFIHISATVDSETPEVWLSFQLVKSGQSVETTYDTIATINSNVSSLSDIGTGSVAIDHNFGGTDNLRIISNGTPVSSVLIRAFDRTDYDNNKRTNSFVVGQTISGTDGRWQTTIQLDPGKYVLEFSKAGTHTTSTKNITVS